MNNEYRKMKNTLIDFFDITPEDLVMLLISSKKEDKMKGLRIVVGSGTDPALLNFHYVNITRNARNIV